MTNGEWFNKKDGEQAFPSLVVTIEDPGEAIDGRSTVAPPERGDAGPWDVAQVDRSDRVSPRAAP